MVLGSGLNGMARVEATAVAVNSHHSYHGPAGLAYSGGR